MSWLAPWAFAGLAFLALPIAIHLLGRGRATTHDFPTLRFLPPSRLLPSRRTRIHDPLLLLLRLTVLAVAVAALAQPLLLTASRRRTLRPAIARAIVLDTSASMRGADSAARRLADSLRVDATDAVLLPTARPADALAGAAAWLGERSGRAELVIVSDFQRGTIDAAALRAVPAPVGVSLRRVGGAKDSVVTVDAVMDGGSVRTEATVHDGRTIVAWRESGEPRAESASLGAIVAAGEEGLRAASVAAASVPVALPLDPAARFAVVSRPAGGDTLLTAPLARALARADADPLFPTGVAAPTVVAGRLTFAAPADPFAAASLLAALRGAASAAPDAAERDPAVLSDSLLRAWARDATGETPLGAGSDASDARWGWLLVLLLLGAEAWYRRRVTAARATDG